MERSPYRPSDSHVLASSQVVSAVPALVSVTQVALHGLTLACRPSHRSPLICRLFCGFIIVARRFFHGSSIGIYVKSKVESTYSSIFTLPALKAFFITLPGMRR